MFGIWQYENYGHFVVVFQLTTARCLSRVLPTPLTRRNCRTSSLRPARSVCHRRKATTEGTHFLSLRYLLNWRFIYWRLMAQSTAQGHLGALNWRYKMQGNLIDPLWKLNVCHKPYYTNSWEIAPMTRYCHFQITIHWYNRPLIYSPTLLHSPPPRFIVPAPPSPAEVCLCEPQYNPVKTAPCVSCFLFCFCEHSNFSFCLFDFEKV